MCVASSCTIFFFVVVLMCGVVVDIVVPGCQSTPREHDQGEEKMGVPKSRGSGW